jgi:RNA polymerase sigma-70 factor (ECF subfamily)
MNQGGQTSQKITTLVALISNPWAEVDRDAAKPVREVRDETAASKDFRSWTHAISGGDEQAFNQFYELYSLRLYKYLLVLCRGNDLDAREVLQTSVLKAARNFKVLDTEEQLWGWLCRLARNAFIDLCRRRARDERFVAFPDLETSFQETGQAPAAMADALQRALDELSADERELLHEIYVDERALGEVARENCQSYKAMESRVGRLRLKLRTRLLKLLQNENS